MSEESTVETTGAISETSEETEAASVSGEEEETQSSESEESEDSTSQEAEEGAEEQEEGEQEEAHHKPTAEERKAQLQKEIQQLANQRRELKEALATEVEETVKKTLQQAEAEKPPFFDVPWERVNEHVAAEMEAIENLKLEGQAAQALFRQRALDKLCGEIEENEAKRQKWTADQEAKKQQTIKAEYTEKAIQEAAEVVRKSKGVTEEDWKLMDKWFDEKCKSDPLLELQFSEKLNTQGPAHAHIWKHEYLSKNLGKAAKADKEKKEQGKGRQIDGSLSGGSKTGFEGIKTFDELNKLSGKQITEFARKHPKAYNKILEDKMNKAI